MDNKTAVTSILRPNQWYSIGVIHRLAPLAVPPGRTKSSFLEDLLERYVKDGTLITKTMKSGRQVWGLPR